MTIDHLVYGATDFDAAVDELEVEHPDPDAITAALRAFGADADVKPAGTFSLVAHIHGPHGTEVLR